ncbi:hypothetical protein N9A86_03085 [Akkermansiaceae bacterium]|nr:hypothetical protein [Akkermansiaceae bacterium]
MSPTLWMGLLVLIAGILYAWASDQETPLPLTKESNRSKLTSSSINVSDKEAPNNRTRMRRTKVLFLDHPDSFDFVESQLEGMSKEAQTTFETWRESRTKRESLWKAGLGMKHPNMIALADREVLLGNRLNQLLRNEER